MKVLSKNSVMEFVKKTAILWVMIILILILSVISPSFFRGQNLLNIIKQASITGVIGVGMTFVLITGGIDLSVGSVMALSGTMAASVAVAEKNMPIALVILVGVGLGALCGLINGIGVSYIGFPPFIMTLGMMTIARGIPLVFTNGTPIFGLSEEFNMIANSRVLGVPSLVIFLVITVLAGHIILSKTVLGRRIYAVGGNEDAARLSGVSTAKVKLFVYVFCGILSGIAGILICSRITSGNGTVAEGYEMNAISAAVIGGVSMTGGSGNVLGMVVGAMILTIIQNSFDIMGVNSFYQNIIKGIIILLAVFLDLRGKKKMLAVAVCVSMCMMAFAGCTSESGGGSDKKAEQTEGKKEESGKVFMTVSNQQNEFMVGMAENFKEVGEAAGYEVQLMDADLDATKQVSQIETAISENAEAILVEPCSVDGLTTGLKEAHDAGIPVFVIHNNVSATDLVTSLIHVDVRQGGELKMEQVIKDCGEDAKIAIMTGTLGQDTTNQICGGYDAVLEKYPNVEVVFEGAGNWGATDAAPLAENWLASGKEIDAIVCNNDGMALGVVPVLKSAGKSEQIKVYGLDATNEGLKAVDSGEMAATIYVDSKAEIEKAFEMLEDLKAGKKVDAEYKVPSVLVTKENVKEYMK